MLCGPEGELTVAADGATTGGDGSAGPLEALVLGAEAEDADTGAGLVSPVAFPFALRDSMMLAQNGGGVIFLRLRVS